MSTTSWIVTIVALFLSIILPKYVNPILPEPPRAKRIVLDFLKFIGLFGLPIFSLIVFFTTDMPLTKNYVIIMSVNWAILFSNMQRLAVGKQGREIEELRDEIRKLKEAKNPQGD